MVWTCPCNTKSVSRLEIQLSEIEVVLNSRWLILAVEKKLPLNAVQLNVELVTVMCKKVTCLEEPI